MKSLFPLSIVALLLMSMGAGCATSSPAMQDAGMQKDKMMPVPTSTMQERTDVMEKATGTMILKEDAMMKKEDAMMKDDAAMMIKGDVMMPSVMSGSYEAYDASKLERAKQGKVVLFFYAPWCPTCQSVDKDIRAHLSVIPKNTSILIADYDSSTTLKKKYGVTYQHTFVQVDEQGTLLKKWSGSPTLNELLQQVR